MQTFDTITDARNAIMDFRADHWAAVPANMRDRFKALAGSPSPVDQIVGVGEFLYANREAIDDAGAGLAAGLIAFATVNAWHGLLEGERGNKVVANLRKQIGEIQSAPAAPDARPGYLIEPPAPAPGDDPEAE